jgi:hypothetical protein
VRLPHRTCQAWETHALRPGLRPTGHLPLSGRRRGPTLSAVIGPLLLLAAGGIAGWLGADWAGAAGGMLAAVVVSVGVAGAAAWWAAQVGRALDPAVAWEVAPRPPLFGPLCDAIYRRVLGLGGPPEGAEKEP